MQKAKHIAIISNRKKIVLGISAILYVLVIGKITKIHISDGKVYETRIPLKQLEEELGDGFIKAFSNAQTPIK